MKYLALCLMAGILLVICEPSKNIDETNSQSIDIQCAYYLIKIESNENTKESLLESFLGTARWWWWLRNKKTVYFSIDKKTKKVTSGPDNDGFYSSDSTTAKIYPDFIGIEIIYNNPVVLESDLTIDRKNGGFRGVKYEYDETTNKNRLAYYIKGSCKPLQRVF